MAKIQSKELEHYKEKLEKDESKKPYWELEDPEVIKKGNLEIEHYKEAGALQIKLYDKNYISRCISLRKFKLLQQPELLTTLAEIFTEWEKEAPAN